MMPDRGPCEKLFSRPGFVCDCATVTYRQLTPTLMPSRTHLGDAFSRVFNHS